MTPEERARADDITATIEQSVKNRSLPRVISVPGVSPRPPAPTLLLVSQSAPESSRNGFRYILIFVLVLVIHGAGFMVYKQHTEAKEQALRDEAAAALREVTAQNERARAESQRLMAALVAQQEIARNAMATVTPSPKIEYNVYTPPPPAPRRQPVPSYQPTQQVVQQVPPDRSDEHSAIASAYLSRKGIYARNVSTAPVSGWDGRYRTEFEVPRNTYTTGTTSPRPKRYEVITEEKNGKITALEYTTKGYY